VCAPARRRRGRPRDPDEREPPEWGSRIAILLPARRSSARQGADGREVVNLAKVCGRGPRAVAKVASGSRRGDLAVRSATRGNPASYVAGASGVRGVVATSSTADWPATRSRAIACSRSRAVDRARVSVGRCTRLKATSSVVIFTSARPGREGRDADAQNLTRWSASCRRCSRCTSTTSCSASPSSHARVLRRLLMR